MGDDFISRFRHWYNMKPVALRTLMAINVVIYLLWIIAFRHIEAINIFVYDWLSLFAAFPDILLRPWQLVTYNFLHLGGGLGGFLHILFNMLWLIWIGQDYEELYGSRQMTWLYLIGGIGGGLLTVIVYALLPAGGPVVVYGASASVLGVMAAVATLHPNKSIALLFIGVIPLKYLVIGFLIFDLLINVGSGVAVTAHLGGALFGFLFARLQKEGWTVGSPSYSTPSSGGDGGFLSRLDAWLGNRADKKEKPKPKRGPRRATSKVSDVHVVSEINQKEVDRILDKISERGYDSLSEDEKRILYEASRD